MGCDIHAYIEFFSKSDFKNSRKCFVDCFAGELSFGRDYILFGLVAGVRHHLPPLIKARGIPTEPELSYTVSDAYYLNVVADDAARFSDNSIRRTLAEEYVSEGYAHYTDSTKSHITNPNYHSATYLTLDELLTIRKMYLTEIVEFYANISNTKKKDLLSFIQKTSTRELMKFSFPDYENVGLYTTICTMMALERVSEDSDTSTRLVCWFDS
jgi:hypothetical protein